MADVYRVGVAIGMTDNASQVISVLAGKMLGLNIAAKDAQLNLNKVRLAAVGLGGVILTGGIVRGLNDMAAAGAKLQDQIVGMQKDGMTHLQIVQETAQAYKSMSEVRGPDVAERIRAIRELRGIAGEGENRSLDEVNQLLPNYLKAANIVGARNAQSLFRAIELRGDVQFNRNGMLDMSRFEVGLDRAIRALQAAGGTITPRELYGLMQQAGPMARMMSPEAFYGTMTTAVMEMGGQRAGTALTAAGRALYGGIMPERNANEMLNLGLYDPKSIRNVRGLSRAQKRELSAMGYSVGRGGVVMVDRHALVGADVLNAEGVGGWIEKVLSPRMHNMFLREQKRNPQLSELQFDMQELYTLFPTETFRRLAGFYLTQSENVARDQRLQSQAAGLGAYQLDQQRYDVALDNVKHSWASLMETMGLPAAQDGAHLLNAISGGLDHLTQVLTAHPDMAKYLEIFAIGTAAVAATGASISIFALAVSPFTRGLGALIGLTAEGRLAASIAGMAKFGASLKGLSAILAANAANDVLNRIDPNDKVGSFIDHYVPGASWLDDKFSYLGWGTSYEGQKARWEAWHMQKQSDQSNVPPTSSVIRARQDATTVKPADTHVSVYLDGKQIAANTQVYVTQEVQRAFDREMRASNAMPDPLSTPRVPGVPGW
ncbi:hypothetical protein AZ09_10360 [Acetobacter aceti 1023]|nr:hypothetical protein AZ09_10360 [Acetobacter aceti 1023]